MIGGKVSTHLRHKQNSLAQRERKSEPERQTYTERDRETEMGGGGGWVGRE